MEEVSRKQWSEIGWGRVAWWKVDPVGCLCMWDCGALEGGPAGSLDVKVEEMSMEMLTEESNVEADRQRSRTSSDQKFGAARENPKLSLRGRKWKVSSNSPEDRSTHSTGQSSELALNHGSMHCYLS